jgi:ActR/RegA family two-component response regulator
MSATIILSANFSQVFDQRHTVNNVIAALSTFSARTANAACLVVANLAMPALAVAAVLGAPVTCLAMPVSVDLTRSAFWAMKPARATSSQHSSFDTNSIIQNELASHFLGTEDAARCKS